MLAVRSILGKALGLSTLIFDEIDTGVSGKVADQIGLELLAIAQHQQVITITHLPVIAGRANKHYLVEKVWMTAVLGLPSRKLKERLAHRLSLHSSAIIETLSLE